MTVALHDKDKKKKKKNISILNLYNRNPSLSPLSLQKDSVTYNGGFDQAKLLWHFIIITNRPL